MQINLVSGALWFAAGLALLVYPWLDPGARRWTLWRTDVNAGWLAFLFALYNLARWWSSRLDRKTRSALELARGRREEKHRLPRRADPDRPDLRLDSPRPRPDQTDRLPAD